ncbi:hypothetical protein HYDPIDRAFT_160371 [Hydnomerulius pinastri MD-312]|uniref:Proteasome assembly chaperone 1 n=1 Tax=Hydnomerulius pinastri MD-312 TaxID=994086 RepID=A0A0C9W3H8_9AGAM|nr:hypothetical protein HYDPIDRAFT_160371 [Hydnomerulius pinastri MD-312]
MEVDPLADAAPPRYAVESDDEDEYNPVSPKTASDQTPDVTVEFKSIYAIPSKLPLVLASGEAGAVWARGANLGQEMVGLFVNKIQVGLLFRPSWTQAVVVVSEGTTRTQLPLFAMNTYSTAIIDRLQPTSVAILDSYPTQGYISPEIISQDNTPIRYLSVSDKPVSDPELELFAPPNLLQSTTASLLSGLFLRSIDVNSSRDTAAVILLPSPKIPPARPSTFAQTSAPPASEEVPWDGATLRKAHKWLFKIIGEEVEESSFTEPATKSVRPVTSSRRALGEVGEGGMYI